MKKYPYSFGDIINGIFNNDHFSRISSKAFQFAVAQFMNGAHGLEIMTLIVDYFDNEL